MSALTGSGPAMADRITAAEWIARRREVEQAAPPAPWRYAERASGNPTDGPDHTVLNAPHPEQGEQPIATGDYDMWSGLGLVFAEDARTSLPKALDAIEAVLELHRENTPEDGSCQGYTDTGYGYLDSWCVECSGQSGREYGTDFPCPTVQAVTEALAAGGPR